MVNENEVAQPVADELQNDSMAEQAVTEASEEEMTPEQIKEELSERQRICDIYLNCNVSDFISKALYAKSNHKSSELKVSLMTVLFYFNSYHEQILALMHTPMKQPTDFTNPEDYKAYFAEENVLRQKHFDNLTTIKANIAVIRERIGFLTFVDEVYTGRPVDLPKDGNQTVDNN